MSDTIDNLAFIIPLEMTGLQERYHNQTNRMLAEFAEEINEQKGTVTVIVPLKGQWYFDFADIPSHLNDRIIAGLETSGFGAAPIKPYAIKMRG